MNKDEMFSIVKEIIEETIDVEPELISIDKSFRNDLGADSLESFEVIMLIEDRFGVEIDEALAKSVDTIKDLIDAIETSNNQASLEKNKENALC